MRDGYLSPHNLYGILSEKLNGWKEIDKANYEGIISKYRQTSLTSEVNLKMLQSITTDF